MRCGTIHFNPFCSVACQGKGRQSIIWVKVSVLYKHKTKQRQNVKMHAEQKWHGFILFNSDKKTI